MSLLMQALKKAERARQSQALEEELHEPELSLSPLDEPDAHPSIPDDVPTPTASVPDPVEVQRDGVPDDQAHHFSPHAPARRRVDRTVPEPVLEPRTMRIAALVAALLLIAATFAYLYWRAMYGPGSSRDVPPVPMPGLQAGAGTTPAAAVEAAPAVFGPPLAETINAPAIAENAQAAQPPLAASAPPQVPAPGGTVPPPALPTPEQMQGLSPEDYSRLDRMAAAKQDAQASQATGAATNLPAPSLGAAPIPSAMQSSDIQVSRSSTTPRINPLVEGGYKAFRSQDLATARAQYQAALQAEPGNRDAILGLAAVSASEGQPSEAANLYARLLDADPRDPDALAGLSSLRSAEPGDAERRLRRALEQHPDSPAALFALGSLVARQNRWSEAQQLFFKAHAAQPSHPDYAFNLAVGLDRLNQPRLARDYYSRALALADAGGPATFDRAAAANRLRELAGAAR